MKYSYIYRELELLWIQFYDSILFELSVVKDVIFLSVRVACSGVDAAHVLAQVLLSLTSPTPAYATLESYITIAIYRCMHIIYTIIYRLSLMIYDFAMSIARCISEPLQENGPRTRLYYTNPGKSPKILGNLVHVRSRYRYLGVGKYGIIMY